MIDTTSDLMLTGTDSVVDRLSRAYADRIERMNEMRERLDRIGEILMPYLKESPQEGSVELEDLKRVMDLTAYDETAGRDAG